MGKHHSKYWKTTELYAKIYPHDCVFSATQISLFVVKVAYSFITSARYTTLKQGNCIWPILKDSFKGSVETNCICAGLHKVLKPSGRTSSEKMCQNYTPLFFFLLLPSASLVFLELPFHHHSERLHLTVTVSSQLIYCNAHREISAMTSDNLHGNFQNPQLHENTHLYRCILHW